MFDQLFVKTGELPKNMSKAIHRAFDLRQIGDYRELINRGQEQSDEVLRSADQFAETAEKYLSHLKRE